jgi:putative ABC transport system permease protein
MRTATPHPAVSNPCGWLEPLAQDVRYSLRGLHRSPRFLLVVLVTLTLGIAANIVAFSVVDAVLLRPLPFGSRGDRVVTVHSIHAQQVRALGGVSYPDLLDLRAGLRSFEGVGGLLRVNFTLSTESEADRLVGCYVTPELLRLLDVAPTLGRHFTIEEAAAPGRETSVMLTDGLWHSRFGGDASIVGRPVIINDRPHTVVGVMPPGFRFPDRADVYLPLRLEADRAERSARMFTAVGVLAPGITIGAAQAELDEVADTLARRHPETNRGYGAKVLSFRDSQLPRDARAMATALMGAVIVVLLIVCANVGTLFLLRNATRRRQLAVRSALGATARRLLVLVLIEVLALTAAAAVLAVAAAAWAIHYAQVSWADQLPFWVRLAPDQRILWFAVTASSVTAGVIALLAILGATRQDLAATLAEHAARLTVSRGTQRARAGLASVQIALSLALLVGAHLLIGSFVALQQTDLGFSADRFLAARVNLSGDAFDPTNARAAYVDAAVAALGSEPGVAAAAATSSVPGDDAGGTVRLVADAMDGVDPIEAQSMAVTSQFADALGLAVIDGRTFTASEQWNPDARVAMLNERLASRLWRGQSAVGRRIGVQAGPTVAWLRIVGVMPDVRYGQVGRVTEPTQLHLYLPYAHAAPRAISFVVRAFGDPASLREQVRRTLRRLRAGTPVFDVRTIRESRHDASLDQEAVGTITGALAGMSLLLASLGVYGLVADSARQRQREVALRLVLGATPASVRWLLLDQARRSGIAGVGLGFTLAVVVTGALRSSLIAVRGFEPFMFLSAAGMLLAVVLVAAYLPARRASRTDPGVILRQS